MVEELRAAPFTLREFFALLDGESFASEADFQAAVIQRFNLHLHEFPPHYDYRDAITWALREKWIVVDGSRVAVDLGRRRVPDSSPLLLAA